MEYTEDIQFKNYINSLVGKPILFKLTDDKDDEGLIGILKQYDDNFIIERDNVELIIKINELYYIEENKD